MMRNGSRLDSSAIGATNRFSFFKSSNLATTVQYSTYSTVIEMPTSRHFRILSAGLVFV